MLSCHRTTWASGQSLDCSLRGRGSPGGLGAREWCPLTCLLRSSLWRAGGHCEAAVGHTGGTRCVGKDRVGQKWKQAVDRRGWWREETRASWTLGWRQRRRCRSTERTPVPERRGHGLPATWSLPPEAVPAPRECTDSRLPSSGSPSPRPGPGAGLTMSLTAGWSGLSPHDLFPARAPAPVPFL